MLNKPSSRNNLRQRRKYYYFVFARKPSMLKQVRSLQGPRWIRMKSTATRGGRAKQLRISTVLDVWVENESQRLKNEDPPPSKSLINSSKRLSRPEICKKQQDLQLSMNLTRVFGYYIPPPIPHCKKTKTPLKIT